jgi:spermidine synthase
MVIPERRFESVYSGEMDVRWERGRLALNSPKANYSFNSLHRVMKRALSTVDTRLLGNSPILNLGAGAGSTLHILRKEMMIPNNVVSVELDPSIIAIGKEFFGLERYTSHEIHIADAIDYLEKDTSRYGLIIVDLFIDKEVNNRFLTSEFYLLLKSHLIDQGQVVFNYIGGDEHPFASHLEQDVPRELLRMGDNQVLIYRNTEVS